MFFFVLFNNSALIPDCADNYGYGIIILIKLLIKDGVIVAQKLFPLFLKARGYTSSYLSLINQTGNRQLKNIDQMAALLEQIRLTQQKIVIMPDFDCDGVTSGSLGFAGLSQLGFNVRLYIPHPEQGYGIKITDIERVLQNVPDVKWLITCDVGQTCFDAFTYAYLHGLKVLVTDHHEPILTRKKLLAECVVNPCQVGETYNQNRPDANFNICGAFVFYQVLLRYTELYQPGQASLISLLATFAGIGTMGDMMPLVQENRLLIKDTLVLIQALCDTPDLKQALGNVKKPFFNIFNGLKIWLQVLRDHDKIFGAIDEKFLSWTLVPMFNSIKRLDLPMSYIFGVFFNVSSEQQKAYAQRVMAANDYRKVLVNGFMGRIKQDTLDQKQPYAPYIFLTDAPGNILGLIANQIIQATNLPVFVINKANLAGSGRSLAYFPVLTYVKHTEFNARGHELAFGINFKDYEQLDRFNTFVQKIVPQLLTGKTKKPKYDLHLGVGDSQKITLLTTHNGIDFVHDAKLLKPYGEGFSEPDLAVGAFHEQARFMTMGRQKQHLKIILPGNIELISWNNAKKLDQVKRAANFVFHGNLSINHFRGHDTLQMVGDIVS